MQQTDKLMHDIDKAEEHTTKIEQDVNLVGRDLQTLYNDLKISEKVNKSLAALDTSLEVIGELCTVISIIPEVGEEVTVLKRSVTEFRIPIHRAHEASNRVEKVIKPIRKRIKQFQPVVTKTDHALLDTINVENTFAHTLGSVIQCIKTLPDSAVKSDLEEKIETVSAKIDPMIAQFDSVQTALLGGIDGMINECSKITEWAEGLLSLDKAIDAVMDMLHPLITAMQAIQNVFNYVITVPYMGYPKFCHEWGPIYYPCGWKTVKFSFSIQQILDGINGVIEPVMKLLNEAMDKILSPLLKALNLNISFPNIPGLDILENIADSIEDVYNSIEDTLNKLSKGLDGFRDFYDEIMRFIDKINEINKACVVHNPLVKE